MNIPVITKDENKNQNNPINHNLIDRQSALLEKYLKTIAPGKMKARQTAVVDPKNWKRYQILGTTMAKR